LPNALLPLTDYRRDFSSSPSTVADSKSAATSVTAVAVAAVGNSRESSSSSTTKLLETTFETHPHHMTITPNLCYDTPLVGGSCTNSPFVGGKLRGNKPPMMCSSAMNLPTASTMETPQMRTKASAKVAPCNTLPSPTKADDDEVEHQYDIPFSHLQELHPQ
jgi:hypothetical protein